MNELTKLIVEFHATLAKFEVIAARMEERELGITMRDLPFPEGLIPPPLPEGKTRWVYRGTFLGDDTFYAELPRHVEYFVPDEKRWHATRYFSTELHHIEAV